MMVNIIPYGGGRPEEGCGWPINAAATTNKQKYAIRGRIKYRFRRIGMKMEAARGERGRGVSEYI